MMNPRAIALQGIGFGALLVAVHGFAPATVEKVTVATPGYTASASRQHSANVGCAVVAVTDGPMSAAVSAAAHAAAAKKSQQATGGRKYKAALTGRPSAKLNASRYVANSTRKRSA